jgi:hypothetical protein
VIADLVPSTTYLIARDGVDIATAPASSQGVLTFSASEGGRFTIRAQSIHAPSALASAPADARSL